MSKLIFFRRIDNTNARVDEMCLISIRRCVCAFMCTSICRCKYTSVKTRKAITCHDYLNCIAIFIFSFSAHTETQTHILSWTSSRYSFFRLLTFINQMSRLSRKYLGTHTHTTRQNKTRDFYQAFKSQRCMWPLCVSLYALRWS